MFITFLQHKNQGGRADKVIYFEFITFISLPSTLPRQKPPARSITDNNF